MPFHSFARRTLLAAAIATAGFAGLSGIGNMFSQLDRAYAQSPSGKPAETAEQRQEREFKAAVDGLKAAAKEGPQTVPLIDQGAIALPKDYVFVPQKETAALMRAMGNNTGSNLIGMLLSSNDGLRWFALLSHVKSGYVKDDDAKTWNADELLQSLKDGTEAGNAERVSRGFAPTEVAGWIAKPQYDAGTQRLIWSALVRSKGAQGSEGSVNYNTYALGREGYFQLNLISDEKGIEGDKKHAATLLAALSYHDGKRYADFDPSKDRVAEYGIAALVAGAAAKKLGLFAAIAAIVVKSWKLVALAAVGLFSVFGRFFRRKGS